MGERKNPIDILTVGGWNLPTARQYGANNKGFPVGGVAILKRAPELFMSGEVTTAPEKAAFRDGSVLVPTTLEGLNFTLEVYFCGNTSAEVQSLLARFHREILGKIVSASWSGYKLSRVQAQSIETTQEEKWFSDAALQGVRVNFVAEEPYAQKV